MNNLLEKYQLVERSIQKKYHKERWTPFVRAIKQYQQIGKGTKLLSVSPAVKTLC